MLRKYTNALLEEIRKGGLELGAFTSTQEQDHGFDSFVIRVGSTPLYFRIRTKMDETGPRFDCVFSTYKRGHPAPSYPEGSKRTYTGGEPDSTFENLQKWFDHWLKEEASRYLADEQEQVDDLKLPDLWAEVSATSRSTELAQAGLENTLFTAEEQTHIGISLGEFARQVEEQNLLAADQIELLHEQVGHLVNASHRLGRKDWLVFLLGSLVTFAASAGFSPDVANTVIKLGGESVYWIARSPLLLH